ncbi:MAG TPA: hypothetical protein VFO27_14380 [Bryobacteraceae bacterium]|nr:hypothetical protein [Bryobacteraceae bacterium]
MAPKRLELPEKYHHLLDWYEREYCKSDSATASAQDQDPILRMWGLGREIWQGVDTDEYVNSLRGDWDPQDERENQ